MVEAVTDPGHGARTETERLRRLADYDIARTEPEASFDDIAVLAATIMAAPIALLCIAEASCHWVKARIGLPVAEVPRSISFCDYTLASGRMFVVLDAATDPRFAENPFVVGPEHVRFYLGVPLTDADGYQLGTLCIIDKEPREAVTPAQRAAMESIARITVDRLELRRRSAYLVEAQKKAEAAEREVSAAHTRLREAIDILPEAIVFMDRDDRFVLWNRRYAELFPELASMLRPGVPYEEVLRAGMNSRWYAADFSDETKESWLQQRLADHRLTKSCREQRFGNGRWMRYDERRTSDGGSVGIRVDITELKRREAGIKLLFDSNPVPLWLCEAGSLKVLAVNDATLRLYGLNRAQALELSLTDLCIAGPGAITAEVERQTLGDETPHPQRHRRPRGTPIDVLPFIRSIDYEEKPALLIAVVDITERLRAEARIKHLAHHDALTDLPNRALFQDRLNTALQAARVHGEQIALCLIDLDHFKSINDSLGHGAGDAVLRIIARRLARVAGPNDTVARLGGDEFAVILTGLPADADAAAALAGVPRIFDDPIVYNGEVIPMSGSAGAVVGPTDGAEPVVLMQNADVALYRSKGAGRNRLTLFDQDMRAKFDRTNTLIARFRQALRDRELVPYYQPVVNLRHFTIRGYEALIRWKHPERGLLAAGEFAEVFDNPEIAVAIGQYMLDAITRDMRTWLDAGIDFGAVALNVTAADLKSEGFAERVLATFAKLDIAPNRLIVEATENSLVERDNATVARVLNTLDENGVYIALDDFGTGHSSLIHLREFNVATLKIDQSFVRDMTKDREDAAIVRGVANLARNLEITTVAEGIETEEQVAMLVEFGCHYGQGYLFGRPMPAEHVPFFSAHRRMPAKTEARVA